MNHFVWDDLKIGMRSQFDVVLTPAMMDSFAILSEDINPLHLDEQFARRAGFAGRVAFGMLTSAFYSQLVGVHLPGERALLQGIDLDFRSPAYIGDKLTVLGEISFLNDAYHRLELKAMIRNQAGKVISKAKIRVGLHET
jgi:3-hydroxybutyryl-CoA dehydratase